jgi:DNA-3-methyladenine glycosylase
LIGTQKRKNKRIPRFGMILPQAFYERDTVTVAKDLLGCYLVHREPEGTTLGRIVEDEAYIREDPAAHSFRGKTERNAAMFGPAGHAYVYRIYGIHTCINVVTGQTGSGEAVLIRALEPVEGIPLMQKRRGVDDMKSLCSGPGKLTQALGITMAHNGASFRDSPLQIWSADSMTGSRPVDGTREIVQTTRIGITKAADQPLRFYIRGNRYISRR